MPQTLQAYDVAAARVDFFKAKLLCEMGPVELNRLLNEKNSIAVIDVRDHDSYVKEHIPGAINIPLADVPKRLADVPRDKTIVCYCWSATCFMSAKACLDLAQRGFKVLELFGGIKAWKDAGFQAEGAGISPGHA
jgi:ArsR family transcriptional regulator